MGLRLMVLRGFAAGEALYAEIIIVTSGVGTSDADLSCMSDLDAL